jgi:heterodisulfide reductase subunit A-like polyferredoxin
MSKYLILGGGISGCTAAGELARLGHQVTVLERDARFGGKVLDYCCKATDSCSRCGVCVAVSQLAATSRQERVRISTGSTIRQARWNGAVARPLHRLRRLHQGLPHPLHSEAEESRAGAVRRGLLQLPFA